MTKHDLALVRDLKALATEGRYPPPGYSPVEGAPALASDAGVRRAAGELSADDWRRFVASSEREAVNLVGWMRDHGINLARRDRGVMLDFIGALEGDEGAIRRLQIPYARGGHGQHGEPDLAEAVKSGCYDKHDIRYLIGLGLGDSYAALEDVRVRVRELGRDESADIEYDGPTYG